MRRVALVLLAGCFSKPSRPIDGDAPVAPGDTLIAPPCQTPPIGDTFEDTTPSPCGAGFEDANASSTIERNGGVLRYLPAPGVANDASCTWPAFSFAQGTFVEVRQPLNTGGSFTMIQIEFDGKAVGIQELDEVDPELRLFDTGRPGDEMVVSMPYDPDEMRWWRLRPEGGFVAGDYSRDGRTWTTFGVTTDTAAPAMAEVSINAGVYNPLEDPGTAELDNFNVCP